MYIEGSGGGGRGGGGGPSRDEYAEALATLCAYLGWQHHDGPKLWGGRKSEEAIGALLVVSGLTRAQFDQVAGTGDD